MICSASTMNWRVNLQISCTMSSVSVNPQARNIIASETQKEYTDRLQGDSFAVAEEK